MGQRIDFAEKIGDMFARMQEKAAAHEKSVSTTVDKPAEVERSVSAARRPNGRTLLPDRHPTRDFFIADILDWALKDDRHTMEHPMFSLSKKPIAECGIMNTMATA